MASDQPIGIREHLLCLVVWLWCAKLRFSLHFFFFTFYSEVSRDSGNKDLNLWKILFLKKFFGCPAAHGVPEPKIRSEPQFQLKPQLRQCWILSPLCWARDWNCVPGLQRCCLSHCTTGELQELWKILDHVYFIFLPFSLSSFLLLHLQYKEVPKLEAESDMQWKPTPQPQQHRIWAASVTATAAWGGSGSLPTERGQRSNLPPHGHYVGFLIHWAIKGTPVRSYSL